MTAFGQMIVSIPLPDRVRTGMRRAMVRPSPLDDPQKSAHAWARYKRLMRLMFGITTGVVIIAMVIIYKEVEDVSPHFFIAVSYTHLTLPTNREV